MSFLRARPVATHDLYGPAHKGLRLAHTQMLARLGACSGEDPKGLARLLSDLVGLLSLSEHHLENEDRWIHAALEARAPGAADRLAQGHEQHRATFEELEALIGQVETASPATRPRLLKDLYLRFTLFVAEDLVHMAEEEQLVLPVLQSLFSNAELQDIEDRIVGDLTPADMIAFGRFLIPAATRPERIALLTAIRASAPAAAFDAILEHAARTRLAAAEFAHLCEGLGIAPPPTPPAKGEFRWGRIPS
jgi:hemerythrin-like domain-containing protein